jgi:predicted TIM-barrel fold metal-dependent hydrolase
MTEPQYPIIDAAVYPFPAEPNVIRPFLPLAFQSRPFPGPEQYEYPNPRNEYLDVAKDDSGIPGSDPQRTADWTFNVGGATRAILIPLTRGLLSDADLATAICAATNDWVVEKWASVDERFLVSIRVNPLDPHGAVKEIERWAGHPRVVQVAVTTQALHPYGQRLYHPVWEAAAESGLPVAIKTDGGSSVGFPVTPVGPVRLGEGVFEKFPSLKVVFADGGGDLAAALLWRLDSDWRSTRYTMPWTAKRPSDYLQNNVWFIFRSLEGLSTIEDTDRWLSLTDINRSLLYGSGYPFWDALPSTELTERVSNRTGIRMSSENALSLYGSRLNLGEEVA